MSANKDVESVVKTSSLVLSDDIESLKKYLTKESLNYVDIASLQAWQDALQKWPLLAEWDAWSKQ